MGDFEEGEMSEAASTRADNLPDNLSSESGNYHPDILSHLHGTIQLPIIGRCFCATIASRIQSVIVLVRSETAVNTQTPNQK